MEFNAHKDYMHLNSTDGADDARELSLEIPTAKSEELSNDKLRNKYIAQRKANAFIIQHHRHHGKVTGDIIRLGVHKNGELVGVAIIGRPCWKGYDPEEICEVTRLGTIGTKNACSKLYSACARIAKELGFLKIITYTSKDEEGISLKASGWILEDDNCGGVEWKRNDGKRQRIIHTLFGEVEKYPPTKRKRWAKILNQIS